MVTEVFNNIGQEEMHYENPNSSFKRYRKEEVDDADLESEKKVEKKSKISEVKKEFIEYLEDESLTVDTCAKVNHDWKKE
jgi:hypothetical protein